MKAAYRKSAGNPLMWSDLTWTPPSMSNDSGQSYLKVLITCLLLVLKVCNVKPTYRKSWAGNLLIWSDLTVGPSYKVKRWFTGLSGGLSGSVVFLVQAASCTNSLYKLQLVQVDLYKLQHVQILDLYKL